MVGLYPEVVTFAVYSFEVPKPTLTIKRNGRIKPRNPCLEVLHASVWLEGDDEWIGVTRAQYRAMIQLVRVILSREPSARIVFNGGASPWGLDSLPALESWMTVSEAMKLKSAHIRKVLVRKKPLHRVIKARLTKMRRQT